MILPRERNYDNLMWLERHGNFMSNITRGIVNEVNARVRWESATGNYTFWGEGEDIMKMYDNLYTDVKDTLWKLCE